MLKQPRKSPSADKLLAGARESIAILARACDDKDAQIAAQAARIAALEAGLRQTSGALENLYAMCNGEVPSLLEDHHSVPKIEAAIGMATALLSPDAAAGVVVVPAKILKWLADYADANCDPPDPQHHNEVLRKVRALLGREGG